MFSVHTTPEVVKNATITGYFGFVFEENLVREIIWLSWRHMDAALKDIFQHSPWGWNTCIFIILIQNSYLIKLYVHYPCSSCEFYVYTGRQTAWNKLLYVGCEKLQHGRFAGLVTPRLQFQAGEKLAWGVEEVRRGLEQKKNKFLVIRLWSDTCKRRGDVVIDAF